MPTISMFYGVIIRMMFMDIKQHHLPHIRRCFRLTPCVEALAMIEVNAVEAVSDFGLVLTFNNGEQRRFDMRPYLCYPVFRRLENPGYFSLARVDYGTVVWPGDIDIAPETLYDQSVPLVE